MGPYNYDITLIDGRIITIGSSTPMDADEIREVQRKYNAEIEAAEGGPLRVAGRIGLQTSAGILKGTAFTASGLLDLIGATDTAEAFESAGEFGEKMSTAGRELAPESTIGKVGGAIGETGGMLVPFLAGGFATRGASVPAAVPYIVGGGLGFTQKYGSRLSQLKQLETERLKQEFPLASEADLQIMARGQAMGPALQSAMQTGLLTMAGGAVARSYGVAGVDTGSFLSNMAAKGGQSAWAAAAKGGLVEGLEEMTDEAMDILFIDKGIPELGYRAKYHPELGHEATSTRLASALALGAFFGAGFSGVGAKAESIRANKELIQMTQDIKRIISPRIEARWLDDAGLSGETISLMEKMRGGEDRSKWIGKEWKEEALQIKGKRAIRNKEQVGRLRELEELIDEDIRADYLTDPNSDLKPNERNIIRKAAIEAEKEIVSLLVETNTSSVEELVEGIKSREKQIAGAELQTLLDHTGSATVEELYSKMTTEPKPAPTGAIESPTGVEQAQVAPTTPAISSIGTGTEAPVTFPALSRQGGGKGTPIKTDEEVRAEKAELDSLAEAERSQAVGETFGPKPLTPTPIPTSNQALGLNLQKTRGRRDAAEEAATTPEFTGPSAIAAQPPDVAVPPVPSKAADLGAILEGPEMRTTRAERRALKKEKKGILRTAAEIKTIKDFRKKLEAWQKERKKTRGARGYELRQSGITDENAIDAGIEAGIAAAKAGESIGASLDAAVKAYKKASKEKVTEINVSDLRDELANRIERELSAPPAELEGAIERRNIDWIDGEPRLPDGRALTRENVTHSIDRVRRRWEEEKTKTGSGEYLTQQEMYDRILELPNTASVREVRDILWDDARESTKRGALSALEGMRADRAQYVDDLEMALKTVEAEAPSPTKKKLVKMRNAIRSWRKKQGGRMSAMPFDTIAAQAVEHALSIAIKVLETTGSMKKALAEAYSSLGETSISKKDFDSSMTGRMIDVLALVEDGTEYADAVAATRAPLEGKVPFQIVEASSWSKEGKPLTLDEGESVTFAGPIETATPLPVREEEGLPDETVTPDPYKLRWGKDTGGKLWKSIKGFFSYGTADVATSNTAYMALGKQFNNQSDLQKKYTADLRVMLFENGPAPYETASKEEKKVAEREFAEYQRKLFDRDKGDPLPSTEGYSEVGKGVIDGWKKVAVYTGNEMVDARVRVRLPNGKYRDFKMIGENFWGRMMLPEYIGALNALTPNTTEMTSELEAFGKILKDAKEIDRISVDNIRDWWWNDIGKTSGGKVVTGDANRAGAEQTAFFSGVDKARTRKKVLAEAMDFTLAGGGQWIYNWSRRMAQVSAYGQKAGSQKDYFDTILQKLGEQGFDSGTEEQKFVRDTRKLAYELTEGSASEKAVNFSGKVATATMLTGVFNAIRNLTGWGPTASVFGLSNSYNGMKKLVEYADAAKQSRSWGTLQNNAELLLSGNDISGGPTSSMDSLVKWGLKWSGFTLAENTVRIHAGFTASSFVTEGIGAVKKENNPELAKEFIEMAERLETNPDLIIREDNPTGEETSKFIRRAVDEVQGGYRFNQLPAYMGTPMGRFMFKFGSYGLQITRAIRRNALAPIAKDPTNIRKWLPLMRFIGTAAANGELLYALRDLLFGKERPDKTLEEIVNGGTPMADAFWRMVNNITYAGTLGIIGDLSGMARSVQTKRRVRNPLEPAGTAIASNTLVWLNNAVREKGLSEGAFNEFMRNQFALHRYGLPAVTKAVGMVAPEWDVAQRQEANRDRAFLRNATRRFQEAVGDDVKNMIGAPTYARSPYTQYYSDVKDELMIGNVKESREEALKFAEALDPEDRDGSWARLSNSVSASQPMKIGDARNKEVKMEFISWARRNLSEADVERILKVQRTYMDTAKNTGLISGGNEQVLKSMKILMNLKAPKGRKSSRTTETDPVKAALKRHRDFMEKALGR